MGVLGSRVGKYHNQFHGHLFYVSCPVCCERAVLCCAVLSCRLLPSGAVRPDENGNINLQAVQAAFT